MNRSFLSVPHASEPVRGAQISEASEEMRAAKEALRGLQASDSVGAAQSSVSPRGPRAGRDANALLQILALLKRWLAALLAHSVSVRRPRVRKPRPWRLRLEAVSRPLDLNESDLNRLLQRHRDLQDLDKLAAFSARFGLPESDFFADPKQVERLIRRILDANPAWLRVARTLAGIETSASGDAPQPEVVWRERTIREMQDVTLFTPDDTWRDCPLASQTLRPARAMHEVWKARLLDQILPPEILLDRFSRGEILIPVPPRERQRLEFRAETRRMEVTVRKPVAIPIESEGAGGASGGQLLYILLDYSASMRGKSATLAMAVIAATLRANLGRGDCRYLFRRYAEAVEPRAVELPLQARTVAEKDRLFDTILATNFNGQATHVNDALEIAVRDIENLRRETNLDASLLLVTDGLAEVLEGARLSLLRAKVKVHTVLVTPARSPSLEAISESFTALDIAPDIPQDSAAGSLTPVAAPARRAFTI